MRPLSGFQLRPQTAIILFYFLMKKKSWKSDTIILSVCILLYCTPAINLNGSISPILDLFQLKHHERNSAGKAFLLLKTIWTTCDYRTFQWPHPFTTLQKIELLAQKLLCISPFNAPLSCLPVMFLWMVDALMQHTGISFKFIKILCQNNLVHKRAENRIILELIAGSCSIFSFLSRYLKMLSSWSCNAYGKAARETSCPTHFVVEFTKRSS